MITIDFETKSYADLTKVGASAYSEDPTTDVICACWGIDDRPVQSWWPGKYDWGNGIPKDLQDAVMDGHEVEAHFVGFERSIWMNVLVPKYGWIMPKDDQWRDLMAVACYLALPASLDGLSRALGYGPKNPEGARLITKYSKLYLKTAKTEIPPEDYERWIEYCKDDVRREQSIGDELGDLPERELEVFLMDQEINMRGLYLDQEGIDAATAIVDQRSEELTAEFVALTGLKPTQRDKVMDWCAKNGIELENLQAEYLEDLLDGELPDLPLLRELPQGEVRRAIEIRTEINKASTKKLDAMSRQLGMDGRARFQTRYHGAVTGRWTGSGFQPLNLNRGFETVAPEQLVRDILYRDPSYLDCLYGDAMDAVAKASRHWIKAQEGSRVLAGDYASIEAVILVCLAGEQWKIDAFANGEPIYELGACSIHQLPASAYDLAHEDKKAFKKMYPQEREDGKTRELACGYQGALGAWLKFDKSGRHTDKEIIQMVRGWRDEHPAIVTFWWALDEAAIAAVRIPGRVARVRQIVFEVVDEWLTMILPNRKRLWYRDPQIRATMPQWHKPAEKEDCAAGTCDCQARPQVTYMAWKNKQWKRVSTYGGKLAENATQATCREILVAAMKRVKALGWVEPTPIVLTVYDEIVCEVPEGVGSAEELREVMCQSPGKWAEGWPIEASVWTGERYKK